MHKVFHTISPDSPLEIQMEIMSWWWQIKSLRRLVRNKDLSYQIYKCSCYEYSFPRSTSVCACCSERLRKKARFDLFVAQKMWSMLSTKLFPLSIKLQQQLQCTCQREIFQPLKRTNNITHHKAEWLTEDHLKKISWADILNKSINVNIQGKKTRTHYANSSTTEKCLQNKWLCFIV